MAATIPITSSSATVRPSSFQQINEWRVASHMTAPAALSFSTVPQTTVGGVPVETWDPLDAQPATAGRTAETVATAARTAILGFVRRLMPVGRSGGHDGYIICSPDAGLRVTSSTRTARDSPSALVCLSVTVCGGPGSSLRGLHSGCAGYARGCIRSRRGPRHAPANSYGGGSTVLLSRLAVATLWPHQGVCALCPGRLQHGESITSACRSCPFPSQVRRSWGMVDGSMLGVSRPRSGAEGGIEAAAETWTIVSEGQDGRLRPRRPDEHSTCDEMPQRPLDIQSGHAGLAWSGQSVRGLRESDRLCVSFLPRSEGMPAWAE